MSEVLLLTLTVLACVGAGLVGGLFFGFSNFIMAALARIAPPAGIAAMQAINVTVLNPLFFLAFFGTAVIGLAAAAVATIAENPTRTAPLVLGAVLYLVNIGVTIARNVPLNEALKAEAADSAAGAALWQHYLARWTLWNHVRTVACLAAAAAFAVALI